MLNHFLKKDLILKVLFHRVPIIGGFNFGLASRMVQLLWCVCGGVLLHMLESNYLTILITPSYEKAVDTPEDIINRAVWSTLIWFFMA